VTTEPQLPGRGAGASPASLRVSPVGLVGQLRLVALYKAAQVGGMLLFAVAAPRLMGPELFGAFAVILSLSTLWMTTSNLGARYVFGRFVPEYSTRGEIAKLRGLFMQMVGLRALIVLAVVPFLYLFLARVLPQASRLALLAAAGSFVAMTTAAPMFSVFYGLNRLGTSMGREAFSRYALLALILILGGVSSLERAALALLVTQVGALVIGIYLCRDLFTFSRVESSPAVIFHHLRFGLVVFGANFLLRTPWRLGESALALGEVSAEEIAYFSVALSGAVAFTRILGETTSLQIPSLSLRQVEGDHAGRDRALGLALKYLSIVGALFVLFVFLCGPLAVRVLWGEEYLAVIPNLLLVAPAALFVPYTRTALSLAVIENRLGRNLQLGLVAVVTFLAIAWLLVPALASRGASTALVTALAATALVAFLQMRRSSVLAAATAPRHLLVQGVAAGVLAAFGGSPLGAAFATASYVVLLFAVGVVTWPELRDLARRIAFPQRAPVVG
jgi:O-antigen/teichoic acid export membrane protein